MYHRVANLAGDPLSLAVSIDHFAQQLEYLARACQPMHLVELIDGLRLRKLPRRAVAITFDDGYSDNYRNAYPLLASAHIPATIFVASNWVDADREFWWDDLERTLLLPEDLPSCLRLSIRGQEFQWQLGSPEDRQPMYNSIYGMLKPLPPEERQAVLHQLYGWSGASSTGRNDYLALTRAELIELSGGGLVEIGGHTRNHPQLSALTADQQAAEILAGKQHLEELTGRSIRVFAYPYGQTPDYASETVATVRSVGFGAALTTTSGYVTPGDDLFRLRRCAVFDWDDTVFEQKVEEFFVIRESMCRDRAFEPHCAILARTNPGMITHAPYVHFKPLSALRAGWLRAELPGGGGATRSPWTPGHRAYKQLRCQRSRVERNACLPSIASAG
jgi:peptidoglycan/xylan/chitin deacetylase (PgdA/CDA1 family)